VTYLFGDFELDPSTSKLWRGAAEVAVQPKVFHAIRYVVENHDRVVKKEELLEAIWPRQHVNDQVVPWTICRARKVLGQDGDANCPIETIRGRGYRFTAVVRQTGQNEPPAPALASIGSVPPARRCLPNDPFIGRVDAMERLVVALHEASAGRGGLVLLTGEAGIGKTRCLNEFATVASGLNMGVWTGRCLEGGRGAAFWPWVQVVRDALAEVALGPSLAAEGQALLDELIPRADVDHHTDVGASGAVVARFWLVEKLSRFLLKCAEASPRVVFLDDVHWADEASLNLLSFLCAELSKSKGDLLVVASARDAVSPRSEAWAKRLGRLGPCERIALSRLEAVEVAAYVSEVTGLSLPADIQSAVYAKCGGNPLFLQEAARQLSALRDRRGADTLRANDITVPGVARDLLRARLTGWPPEICEVLEVACVIGQEFDVPLLQAALRIDAQTLLLHLEGAANARLIAGRRRAGHYGFVHDTIRDALYEELSTARRIDLHGKVARALESRPRGEFRIKELAYHSYRALPSTEPARVEQYARKAAELAMGNFAYEEALEFYEWALEAERFGADVDSRNQCELLLALATAMRLSGRVRDAQNTVARAIEIARQNRFADLLCAAARGLRPSAATALVADPLALQALEEASALVTEDECALRIRVLAQLACLPPYSLSIAKSQELSARAVALAREGSDPADLVEALRSRLHALSGPDTIDELLHVADEISSLKPYAMSNQRGEAEIARFHALIHKGDMIAAERALEDIGHVGRTLRRPETLWHYKRARATLAFQAGRFDETEAAFRDLFAQGRRLRLPYGKFFFMTHVLVLAYERTGFSILQRTASKWRMHLDWAASLPSYKAHEIRFLLEMGRTAEARRAFDAMASAGFENITRELGYLDALAQLSVVAVAFGDRARGESLYALLDPYPNHNTPTNFGFYHGSVSYFLGQLAGLLGRTRDAAVHLEDALAMNTRLGCAPQVARTQLALAAVLADGGARGVRTRSRELVAQAAATARRLDMAPLLEQIERFRGQASPGGAAERRRSILKSRDALALLK
jgi:DNA-binding winged helix-turn-helix (wHTH) protein/tetratricopeptide (TPR) repeat protein